MTTGLLEADTLAAVADVGDGDRIRTRREEFGLSVSALAQRVPIDRGRLAEIEKGEGGRPRGTTLRLIEQALDRFEEEVSGPYDVGTDTDHLVTFRMSGNFGVDVTVSGPVENLPELEESVGRLLQRMRNGEPRE